MLLAPCVSPVCIGWDFGDDYLYSAAVDSACNRPFPTRVRLVSGRWMVGRSSEWWRPRIDTADEGVAFGATRGWWVTAVGSGWDACGGAHLRWGTSMGRVEAACMSSRIAAASNRLRVKGETA